ncbi:MAG: phosphoribosyltransferase family protein [Vicinamibacterales bacterium]
MAIIEIHPEPINGPWIEGFVLNRHVLKSVPIGYYGQHMQFDTTRSALGELVYQLKNKNGPPGDIIETAADFAGKQWASRIDCLIAAPPSVQRAKQPAVVLAEGIAAILKLELLDGVVVKAKPTSAMKDVPPDKRSALLKDAIQAGPTSVAGRSVLIVDDLWQTGGTMRRVAEVVTAMGASEVRALAITRTK